MNHLRIAADFDLAQTLDCGQAFRWRQTAQHTWQGAAFGKALTITRQGEQLELDCSPEEFRQVWHTYFDLDQDYRTLREALSALSPVLAEAAAFAPGIRILRQEPWEALCSFIMSQNNHILRIKTMVGRFCQLFGDPIAGSELHAFPTPERVAGLSPEDLAPLHPGYRAGYIIDAAQKVAGGQVDLLAVAKGPAEFGRQELRKIRGVGPKVAECALLYGFHKTECFPMDVWMKRAMATLLPDLPPARLGPYAGLAQQYIFHYSRMHPELFA